MGLLLLFAISCDKEEEDNSSSNPTNGQTSAVFNSNVNYGSLTDQEGNIYKTVTIGEQTWMAENLRTTKYNDGTSIPCVTDDDQWMNTTTGQYCNYNNTTDAKTIATYGRIYDWNAVITAKLCPSGWHIPSDTEWEDLRDTIGGSSVAGGKLKETGTTHWDSPNSGATNETGFTALPAGSRNTDGTFENLGRWGGFFSSTEKYGYASDWFIYSYNDDLSNLTCDKTVGVSVRCVKD